MEENKTKQDIIHDKGFNLMSSRVFSNSGNEQLYMNIKSGSKTIEDATLELGLLAKVARKMWGKEEILGMLANKDYESLRAVSEFFYDTSGIYARLCNYFAYLFRYDWYAVPYVKTEKHPKVLETFSKLLDYLDASDLKENFGGIALKVLKYGVYYGYLEDANSCFTIQQLPTAYCRSRFSSKMKPVVEFNLKFFDNAFRDTAYRNKILAMFPKDIQKGYVLYKRGKLDNEGNAMQVDAWYTLDADRAFKINLNDNDAPFFVNVITAIIDLDEAQDLDRKKMMQKLLKIIVQKLPLDKNGDLIFDVDEARDVHNNAVMMLQRAIGTDVLTTFAEVDVVDMADRSTVTSMDELQKIERGVFNQSGVSANLFNADGNIALDKSITNDEANIRDLIYQFQTLANMAVKMHFGTSKKVDYRAFLLETTIYNYFNYSDKFKALVQLGYSRILPMVSLGIPQSTILAMATFENEILDISSIMIPPMLSSTMSGKTNLGTTDKKGSGGTQEIIDGKEEKTVGRPKKADDEKSDKTLANEESIG